MKHRWIQANSALNQARYTFFEISANSESSNDRHEALYNTWKVSGVLVLNNMLSMGLKSKYNSTRFRMMGRIGELPIFESVLRSRPEMKNICAAAYCLF